MSLPCTPPMSALALAESADPDREGHPGSAGCKWTDTNYSKQDFIRHVCSCMSACMCYNQKRLNSRKGGSCSSSPGQQSSLFNCLHRQSLDFTFPTSKHLIIEAPSASRLYFFSQNFSTDLKWFLFLWIFHCAWFCPDFQLRVQLQSCEGPKV